MTINWIEETPEYHAESLDGACFIKLLKGILDGSIEPFMGEGSRTAILMENLEVKAVIGAPEDEWENFLDKLQKEVYQVCLNQPCA